MKKIAIHQPDYIPWIGFYYKVAHSDCFVYLDDAQFSNQAAHNFNDIKTPQGKFRLKIPVQQKLGDKINEVKTKDDLGWKEKHLKTIEMNYKKAKYFKDIFQDFSDVLLKKYNTLADLNIALNQYILDGFCIKVPIVRSSNLQIYTMREKRIIDICKRLNATEYLSGNGAKVYQNETHFKQNGIKLEYLNYSPIRYNQLWDNVGFLPCMSIIDYIFNCGFDFQYIEDKVESKNE